MKTDYRIVSAPPGTYWPCCASAWRRLRSNESRRGYATEDEACEAIARWVPRHTPGCVGHFEVVEAKRK